MKPSKTKTKTIEADVIVEEPIEESKNVRTNEEIMQEMSASTPSTKLDESIVQGAAALVQGAKEKGQTGILNRISDKGEINLSNLTDDEVRECREIGKRLDVHDVTSISNFGNDLLKVMDESSKRLLASSRQVKVGDETKGVINGIMEQLSQIDLDDIKAPNAWQRFIRKVPVLNKLFYSIDKFLANYDSIEKQVQKCEDKLEAVQVIALRDNTRLQHDFDDTTKYISVLEKLIVAAKMKSQEMETGIEIMRSNPESHKAIDIQDMENYKHELDKRITKMLSWRLTFTQSLFRIRDIQRSNIANSNEVHDTVQSMMPMLRQQLSQATALYNLEQGVKANRAFKEGFNKILRQNADAAHDLAVAVMKETEDTDEIMETLRHNQERLVQTMRDVKNIWDEGEKKRKDNEIEIARMHSELDNLAVGMDGKVTDTTSAEAIEAKYTA
jgi:uncharacterized protein YaaN involved in tellurite resistance